MTDEYRRARMEVLQLMAQAATWINTLPPDEADLLLVLAHDDLRGEVTAGRENLRGGAAQAFADAMVGHSRRVPDAPVEERERVGLRLVDGGHA